MATKRQRRVLRRNMAKLFVKHGKVLTEEEYQQLAPNARPTRPAVVTKVLGRWEKMLDGLEKYESQLWAQIDGNEKPEPVEKSEQERLQDAVAEAATRAQNGTLPPVDPKETEEFTEATDTEEQKEPESDEDKQSS